MKFWRGYAATYERTSTSTMTCWRSYGFFPGSFVVQAQDFPERSERDEFRLVQFPVLSISLETMRKRLLERTVSFRQRIPRQCSSNL